MKANFLKISGIQVLTRENLKTIKGSIIDAADPKNHDLSLCGCDCAGAQTGPDYCSLYLACQPVYTCNDTFEM